MRLVLASNNAKKVGELAECLKPLGLDLVAQSSLGIAEADEPFSTFIENALAKARHAAAHVRGPALADDSGLCVDALGGAPGVFSARFAQLPVDQTQPRSATRELQRSLQDAGNNALLLERMAGVDDRRARFVSVLVAVRSAEDPEPLVALGRWHGEILRVPRGEGGFGYDPLLFIPELSRSVAELDAPTKNVHSHRARATAQLIDMLRTNWHLGALA